MFALGAVLALGGTVVFAQITPVRPPPRPRQSLRDTFGILVRDKPFAQLSAGPLCMGIGNIMAGTLYPLVIVDKLHAGYGSFGVLAVITALGYLRVLGRLGSRRRSCRSGVHHPAGRGIQSGTARRDAGGSQRLLARDPPCS